MERDSDDEGTTPPEEAFAALGDRTRIEILRTLAEDPTESTSFSELRDRVGVRDSGQFNYHLGKLLGRFVRKTDDGYTTTFAGFQVAGAILAGTYTDTGAIEPIEIDDPCPSCGAPIVVRYEDEQVDIECSECDEFRASFGMPPGVVDSRDRESLPEAFDRWLRLYVERIVAGFCPTCHGPTTPSIDREGEDPIVVYRCERCGDRMHADPTAVVFSHPAVVSFYYDHGVDSRREPTWRLIGPDESDVKDVVSVIQENPLRVRVRLELENERLDLVLDQEIDVVDVERSTIDA